MPIDRMEKWRLFMKSYLLILLIMVTGCEGFNPSEKRPKKTSNEESVNEVTEIKTSDSQDSKDIGFACANAEKIVCVKLENGSFNRQVIEREADCSEILPVNQVDDSLCSNSSCNYGDLVLCVKLSDGSYVHQKAERNVNCQEIFPSNRVDDRFCINSKPLD